MDGFGTIRLHIRTIKRFKRFSRKIKKSYSETLEVIIDFFEWHGISPESKFPKRIGEDGIKTRKRINALIAIMRDIEKTQTMPTNEMMMALFGQHEIVKKKKYPEKVEQKMTKGEWDRLEGMIPQQRYDKLKEKHKREKEEVLQFLLKVKLVKPRFGKPYWSMETNANELDLLKNKMRRDF